MTFGRSSARRVESDDVTTAPNDYVIPNRRLATVRRAERCNKVIWNTVVIVAERVGVVATAHALRRAFAVAFLESHPGALESLQALMNHSRIDTTQVYLKALNRSKAMEAVRDLRWGSGFVENALKAHTGLEQRCKSASSARACLTGVSRGERLPSGVARSGDAPAAPRGDTRSHGTSLPARAARYRRCLLQGRRLQGSKSLGLGAGRDGCAAHRAAVRRVSPANPARRRRLAARPTTRIARLIG
jgi:Phage integrase family